MTPLTVARVAYLASFAVVLLITQPWLGGEAGAVYAILVNLISFPAGVIPSVVSGWLSWATKHTALAEFFCCSAFWWIFVGVGCAGFGYAQWFVVWPRFLKWTRTHEF
jgi:hypothetical protein